MDSKDAEELQINTEDTLVWNKKRGRRVSFAAEITSVHVFDRDDNELETPSDPQLQPQTETDDDVPVLFKDLEGYTDDNDGGYSRERSRTDDSNGVGRRSFLQPFESPSPASDFASATSNDDDYFGPVSSEFIRPGRLSDSVDSDDNHEITMDSTAFSMHFQSLAKWDSGYLKTPTGSPLVFEEKTPTQSATTNALGSSMELTRYNESDPHVIIPVGKFSSGKDSNDMSLFEANPRKYDYANISPRLDELISVGSKFPRVSTSEFNNGINATEYILKRSSSQKGSASSRDVLAADLGNPCVRASDTEFDSVKEELLASSHSLESPRENKKQSTSKHNTATEISNDLDTNHVEAHMPVTRSGKMARGDLLKLNETTPENKSSDQNCVSHSPVIPYPSSLVELSEDSHGESILASDMSHNTVMPYQSPSVAISSLKYDLKVNSSVYKFSSRFEDILHLDLNQQSPSDKVIGVSPETENGELMDIMSSGSCLNVGGQKLDSMSVEQNLYSRSPLNLTDQGKSLLQAHPLLSRDSSGLLQNTEFLQTRQRNEAIVQTPSKESSTSAFEEYVTNLKAPESNVHKRRHDQIVTRNQHSEPNVDNPRSPKLSKKEVNESVRLNNYNNDAESSCRSIVASKNWSAIFSEALVDSEQSCYRSFKRLDLRKIEILEDTLLQFLKMQNVAGICDIIQTKRAGNHNNMERNRRISKTKELLRKMLFERAILKLVHAKREKLQERVEIVRSSFQCCRTIKLNCSQLRASVECNAKPVHCDPQSLTAQLEGHRNLQIVNHEIPKMRQKVTATLREIEALMFSFYTCFKMKEKCTNVDIITLVNDCLKRRALFKSLRADVQLWEINDMVYKNGQNKISLNYHGYLIQRFTLVAPISTVTVSYMLNYSNIEKKFPNIEAHMAFSYVFNEEAEQKYVGIRSLARETQVTSSLLSSLLDVIEEVKLARLEFKYLKEAKFRSRSAKKLDLCLHFVDFKTSTKAHLTLDISCLSCGVYPSDVIPSQVQSYPFLNTDSVAAGFQAAVETLEFGSSRILRICRCISSNVLESL